MIENWHTICRAIYNGVEGLEWENLYYKDLRLHQAVNKKKQRVKKKARALWSMRDAQIQNSGSVRIPAANGRRAGRAQSSASGRSET